MYEYLEGTIAYKKPDYVALDINGVGYKVYIPLRAYNDLEIGTRAKLYIYNHIKEDTFRLIGFCDERERTLFELLVGVKGIGITLAIAVISTFDIDTLRDIVASGNIKSLKKVPKMGEKKAEQLILDLKSKLKTLDKLATSERTKDSTNYLDLSEDLYEALAALGYTSKEIGGIVTPSEIKEFKSLEEAIKIVLQKLKK